MRRLQRRAGLAALVSGVAAACAPTSEQQASALTPTAAATAARARGTRSFDTADTRAMLQSVVCVLQDLGFVIGESQAQQGVVVGTKASGGLVRAQVVLRPAADRRATVVWATFQRMIRRPGAMLPIGETLDDPLVYQGFFEKLAQSAFLTAHEI
jgi:hypothetical protein